VANENNDKNIIVIGSSTGGPAVLVDMLSSMPNINASVVIVQHIEPRVGRLWTRRLKSITSLDVGLAETGSRLVNGKVFIAPGRSHLKLINNRVIKVVENIGPDYCFSSVNTTMMSLSKPKKGKIIGVILTGMGNDGAEGIKHIKMIGGHTIAQDEKTSAIYSMPKWAHKTGHVDHVLPASRIVPKLVSLVGHED
jgi:two-component system chemotaxis response regulator CheB